jgi:hypothetical protein
VKEKEDDMRQIISSAGKVMVIISTWETLKWGLYIINKKALDDEWTPLGTWRKITDPLPVHRLHNGDRIRVGDREKEYRAGS